MRAECWYDESNGGTGVPPCPKKHQEPRPKAGARDNVFTGTCHHCKIEGHCERDCKKKKFDAARMDAANEEGQARKISGLETGELER
eukprot:2863890-Karenia_brevis.AAC.1